MSELKIIPFHTVGQLRKALEGVPDDRIIMNQVVGFDGTAWNMYAEFCGQVAKEGSIACLTFKHEKLLSVNPVTIWK